MPSPTIVSFEVVEGQVWIDPEGRDWTVKRVGAFGVELQRPVRQECDTRELVRLFRLKGDRLDAKQPCGRLLMGQGTDTYDPLCVLPAGHHGPCAMEAA